MKSKITIEVDFENANQPVIQILSRNSDDVRDNLIKSFLQKLGHQSTWCRIQYDGEFTDDMGSCRRWKMSPISISQLSEEVKLMESFITHQGAD